MLPLHRPYDDHITPEADGAQALFGDEQVNTYIANEQYYPFVTRSGGLQSAAMWWSGNPSTRTAAAGYPCQRYNAQGVQWHRISGQHLYRQRTRRGQARQPGRRRFIVVWRSEGQDGSSGGVYAQRYDAAGATAGQ